jgi:anaerobic selenocysteine-containing dehydrogenase
MAFSTEKAQSSQWAHPRAREGPAVATLHPEAAAGFEDDGIAQLESALGAMDVRLKFDARQRRDVVLLAKGGWLRDGRCANAIIPAAATDAGGGAIYYDTPVRLVRR